MNSPQSNLHEQTRLDAGARSPSDFSPMRPNSDLESISQNVEHSIRSERRLQFSAALAGVAVAMIVAATGGAGAVWGKVDRIFSSQKDMVSAPAPVSDRDLDRQKPQEQAEILLEQAVSRSAAANGQIARRANHWRGRLHWDSQLGALTTAALNSSDLKIRVSGIEVQLAAYGLAKDEPNVNRLVRQSDSRDHARKVWALWSLGLIGNRGIEPERVVQVLAAHLKDADEDSRRWAVEALALVGTNPTIGPLLRAMHDDPSAVVREQAACSLAQSGMLTHEQRLTAVPQLLNYSDDPALDAQTRVLAFEALGQITGQQLPNDAAAWRAWYQQSEPRD
jgi:hypothetical protein